MSAHHHHGHEHLTLNPHDARYREIRKVTLVGSAVDLILAAFKLIFGFLGQSQALIADGIHSLSDLGTDFIVLYAAKHASKAADEGHPYGHERFETIATVALGLALIAVAIGIIWDAGNRLFEPESLLHPGWLALVIAAASVVLKEAIYHYTIRAAKKYRSKMLHANAWHSRTDAISSVIVIFGVGGAMMGLEYLDAIAAILVGVLIAKIGWELSWSSLHELTDAGLEQKKVEAIEQAILSIGGVKSLHMLRTRLMGGNALVDVHILVDEKLSVSEGHQISEMVRTQLIAQVDEVTDVMVHIDPEDDERARPNAGLPTRTEALKQLTQAWQQISESQAIQRTTLHYLNGQIQVEILLPLNVLANIADASTLAERFSKALDNHSQFAQVDVRYH